MRELIEEKSQEIEEGFRRIQNGVNGSVDRLECFMKDIDPHIQYFFGKGENDFASGVIRSSEIDLKEAMSHAVENMNGDMSVHESSRTALMSTMDLGDGVGRIVELLEYIEIFSLNTMIISAKAGSAGEALSTISIEMTRLSRLGNQLSIEISDKMTALENSISGFDALKEEIEQLHETNLTHITLASSTVFSEMHRRLMSLSGEVLGDYALIESVTETLKSVVEKYQFEDIVRQGFQKVLYSAECYESEKDIVVSDDGSVDQKAIRRIFGSLSQLKIKDIESNIVMMFDKLKGSLGEVLSVIDVFTNSVSGIDSANVGAGETSFKDVDIKLRDLRKRFGDYVDDILGKKENMRVFLEKAGRELDEFSLFFSKMLDISHKFKIIILLTHIEIARSDELSMLIRGALVDVRNIPERINRVVDGIKKQYEGIIGTLRAAIDNYRKMFFEQREVLNTCISLMNAIMRKMSDSRSRRDKLISESNENANQLTSFISESFGLIDEMREKAGGFGKIDITLEEELIERDTLRAEYNDIVSVLINSLKAGEGTEQYVVMMLVSLLREYSRTGPEREAIEMF
jgi:hypothetical protein